MSIRTLQTSKSLGQFLAYALVGVLNTAVHWVVFLALVGLAGAGQALANLVAFGCAVTVSFFVNARVTFRSATSAGRYAGYVLVLGALSVLTGAGAERAGLPPLATLVGFSALSLVIGFLYARYVAFAGPATAGPSAR